MKRSSGGLSIKGMQGIRPRSYDRQFSHMERCSRRKRWCWSIEVKQCRHWSLDFFDILPMKVFVAFLLYLSLKWIVRVYIGCNPPIVWYVRWPFLPCIKKWTDLNLFWSYCRSILHIFAIGRWKRYHDYDKIWRKGIGSGYCAGQNNQRCTDACICQ